jgi:hypothetical protein
MGQVDQGSQKHNTLDVMAAEIGKQKSHPSTRQNGTLSEIKRLKNRV